MSAQADDPRLDLAAVIKPLSSGDLDAITRIENASYPFPWSRGIFEDCLAVGCPGYGLWAGGGLVGYAVFNHGADEAHLLNLCVDPDWRRRGLGALLLEHVIERARALRCECVFLEVRPSNPEAAGLYERRGFTEIGRRPGYYPAEDGREDARVLRLDLG